MSNPKCLRCGAGSEWIKGRVPDEVPEDKPSAPVEGVGVEQVMAHYDHATLAARVIELELAFHALMALPCSPEQEAIIKSAFQRKNPKTDAEGIGA